jgi:hypothetical protein
MTQAGSECSHGGTVAGVAQAAAARNGVNKTVETFWLKETTQFQATVE